MTTTSSNTCPQCGALIPEDSAHGLCPRCVFAKALAPTVDGGCAPYVPPSLESVRAAFPHLEVTGLIGSGGMGAVFKARQPQLDRFVALKILPAELAEQPGFSERFQREAQALARLSHPHIVTVHDFGQAGGFYYLLMEFIDGVNLRQLLQTKRLTPKEALSIVPPICEALQCAHDHGIVHRDIKPENLLIDKTGVVKIADFGIAKIVERTFEFVSADPANPALESRATMPFGTPDYAAPEQASGSADHRADIYSLGVVLYEMLTGERPTTKLEAPSKRVQVDIRIDEIVLRALEKSPELRFATAAEFRTCVEDIQSTSSQTVPGSAASISRPWVLPMTALALLCAGGIMLGVGAYAVQHWDWGTENGAMLAGVVLPLIACIISGWRLFREPRYGALGPVARAVFSVIASLGVFRLFSLSMAFWVPVGQRALGQSSLPTFLAVLQSFSQVVWALEAGAVFSLYVWTQRRIQGATTRTTARITTGFFALLTVYFMVPWLVVASAKLAALRTVVDILGTEGAEVASAKLKALETSPTTFGPVMERVVKNRMQIDFDHDAQMEMIVFKQEGFKELVAVTPAESAVLSVEAGKQTGMDAFFRDSSFTAFGMNMKAATVEDWDAPSGAAVLKLLGSALSDVRPRVFFKAGLFNNLLKPSAPIFAFQTREGGMGLLQIIGSPDNDVKIRYKMVQIANAASNAAAHKTNKPPNEVPFKDAPKLRYIAWMPKDESGWQLRTPSGEAVAAPGDIPVADWEWWKKGVYNNHSASEISGTSGWLMLFYSHPAIDQRSENHLKLFTSEGEEIKVTKRTFLPREPKSPQADGWLFTGCRVPYAVAKGPLKARLTLTAGPWWSSEPIAAGKTNNSGGGQILTNSGEDAGHRAFVTVVTQDEQKFSYSQWEVLGRLQDGSDERCISSTAVNFQSQYIHTISFRQPLSAYKGFIMRNRERRAFTNEGVQVPPVLIADAELDSRSTLQMRWVRDTPSADTEPITLAGRAQSETLNVEKTVLLDQSALQSVEAIHRTQGGGESVSLQLTEDGKQRFAHVTREGKGRKLAIVIDGQVHAAPMIQAEISDGRVEISGNLTYEEADDLAARLMNALPSEKAPAEASPKAAAPKESKTTDTYHEFTKTARTAHREQVADLLLQADHAVIFLLDFDIVPDRRLTRLTPHQSGLNLIPSSKFPIYPMGTTANVLDRKALTKKQLAPLLPHLAQAVRQEEGGHDWCHFPIHGLRLFRGKEEIFESSFCWVCSTFTLLYPDHSDLHPVHDEELQRLMEQLMPIPSKELERFKAKRPNLFLFRAPEEVITQVRNDLTALMELPASFGRGPDDVATALSDIHAEIARQPKAFEYTREELAAFRKDECPYADTDIEKAFAKLQAAVGGRPLPELIAFYRTKFAAGSLTPRQKTICYRMVSAALLEAGRTSAKP